MKKTFQILFISVLLASCTSERTIRVVNLENPTKSISLKFSELIPNQKVIFLETNDEFLVGSSRELASNNYILTIEESKIEQFSIDGKHIRTLAFRGNGPNEFSVMVNPIINHDDEILYYTDFKGINLIYGYDLQTGAQIKPIQIGLENFSVLTYKDGSLYGTPNSGMKVEGGDLCDFIAFRYDVKTKELTKYKGSHEYNPGMMGNIMLNGDQGISFINLNYSDTLYTIKEGEISAELILKMDKRIDGLGEGSDLRLFYTSSNEHIIEKIESEVIEGPNGSLIRRALGSKYLYISGEEVSVIETEQIGDIKYSVESSNLPFLKISGNKILLSLDPSEYLERVAPDSQVNEDGNPIIIIGDN